MGEWINHGSEKVRLRMCGNIFKASQKDQKLRQMKTRSVARVCGCY